MATVNSRAIVDEIIEGNGYYEDDELQVVKIVQYNNIFDGGITYGLIWEGEDPWRYHKGEACLNPRTIWEV
jgi:hypothetical protein